MTRFYTFGDGAVIDLRRIVRIDPIMDCGNAAGKYKVCTVPSDHQFWLWDSRDSREHLIKAWKEHLDPCDDERLGRFSWGLPDSLSDEVVNDLNKRILERNDLIVTALCPNTQFSIVNKGDSLEINCEHPNDGSWSTFRWNAGVDGSAVQERVDVLKKVARVQDDYGVHCRPTGLYLRIGNVVRKIIDYSEGIAYCDDLVSMADLE